LIFRDCETIAAKSYHRGLGVGFFDDEPTRELFSLAAAQGWLRSYILYIDGRPSAFWNGFLYRNTFVIRDTAYESGLSELRPGLYLLQRLVEDLCACGSVRELDFGTGSAQYKRDMCEASRLSVSKYLFAPTLKGIFINALRTPPLALSVTAKWVLTRSGFFEKVRRVWRSRVALTASTEGRQQGDAGG
jgi:CelD/BcsL family acetyltransferase involved in cellulose biosynthesis